MIARRGLRHRRPGRAMSVVLAVAVVVALLSGLAHSTGLLIAAFGITALQVHVGAALVALVPMVVHVRQRRIRPRSTDFGKRSVLRGGMVMAAAGGLYAILAGTASLLALPGARRRATGSYELASGQPRLMPNTSWLLDEVPAIDPTAWRLTVSSGGSSRQWSLTDLEAFDDDAVTTILDCTGGWWSEQRWTGVRVSRLLPAGRDRERRGRQRHRVLPPPAADRRPAARGRRRRRAAEPRSRRANASRRSRPSRIPLGEVGGANRARRPALVARASGAAAVIPRPPRAAASARRRRHRRRLRWCRRRTSSAPHRWPGSSRRSGTAPAVGSRRPDPGWRRPRWPAQVG